MYKKDLSMYVDITENNLKNVLIKVWFLWDKQMEIMNFFIKNLEKGLVIFIWENQISWSISPFMHNYNFYLNDCNLSYLLFPIAKEKFLIDDIMDFIISNEKIVWANVSMPYKLEVYKYLKERNLLDKSAIFAGAVNTIVKSNWNIIWYNTDIDGIDNPIKEKLFNDFDINNRLMFPQEWQTLGKWYVLWAWWASRAVVWALLLLWINEIVVFNRSNWNLEDIKNHFYEKEIRKLLKDYWSVDYKIDTVIYDVEDDKSFIWKYFDLPWILVNTLPFWFKKDMPKYPLKNVEFDSIFSKVNLYFDIVYDLEQTDTPMEQYIKENYENVLCCNWVDMVIWQAKKWFEMWSGWVNFDENLIKKFLKK